MRLEIVLLGALLLILIVLLVVLFKVKDIKNGVIDLQKIDSFRGIDVNMTLSNTDKVISNFVVPKNNFLFGTSFVFGLTSCSFESPTNLIFQAATSKVLLETNEPDLFGPFNVAIFDGSNATGTAINFGDYDSLSFSLNDSHAKAEHQIVYVSLQLTNEPSTGSLKAVYVGNYTDLANYVDIT